MNKKYVGLLASAGALCLPSLANAAGPSLSEVLVNSGITAAGYVDASYDATFNRTGGATGGQVPLHAFDTNSNTFELNQAALTLSYLPTDGFGALVNVIAGEDAKVINGSYSPGSASDFALTQGYVQYAHGPWTAIGGRFVTLAGAEVIDDTKNTNISRSLLFTNLEPLVHTGVRGGYKFSDLVTGYLGVNNSAIAGLSQDENKPKTVEVGAAITPSSAVSISLVDYYGVDKISGTQTKNNYFDIVGSWQATSALQFVLNGDYVRGIGSLDTTPFPVLANATLGAGGPVTQATKGLATGEGLAFYVNNQFNDSWKGSLRAEYTYFKGSPTAYNGSGIAHVAELTATADYSASKNFDLLGEVREDYGSVIAPVGALPGDGNIGVFPNTANAAGGVQKSQTEVLVKAIYKFGTPTGS
ncbi:MAG: outer membrane beta-barrel protein [Nevskia sp.]|nr:outer membrane beta-barrel protein [Nevskia sp.]